jgi:hypothetical protein
MPVRKATSLSELEAQKKAVKETAAARIAEIRKDLADKTSKLHGRERQLRAQAIRDRKKQENHRKILVGVATIFQCQKSETAAAEFRGFLHAFYADSPNRLKGALEGLNLTVKKPTSDSEQT